MPAPTRPPDRSTTTIDTVFSRHGCECGQDAAYYHLVIGGRLHPEALILHDDGERGVNVYFEPPELRVKLETDPQLHPAMHAALRVLFEQVAS